MRGLRLFHRPPGSGNGARRGDPGAPRQRSLLARVPAARSQSAADYFNCPTQRKKEAAAVSARPLEGMSVTGIRGAGPGTSKIATSTRSRRSEARPSQSTADYFRRRALRSAATGGRGLPTRWLQLQFLPSAHQDNGGHHCVLERCSPPIVGGTCPGRRLRFLA